MGHKCFISFKTEDLAYKEAIQNHPEIDMIDKSLNDAIDSEDEDYIMQKIRKEYLSDSTVTIHLIGSHSSEKKGSYEQRYIKRELQASLYNGEGNTRSGILGVVLPSVGHLVYKGSTTCTTCGGGHNWVVIDDTTVVKEFGINYYIPQDSKCSWTEDDRYCVLVPWDTFISEPNHYIDQAFAKRTHPIAKKVKVYPK